MRRVWISKRKRVPGQYVEWYDDDNRRRSKYFAPEYSKYIKIFQTRKFAELNADCRPIGSVISIPWESAKKQYLNQKKLDGLAAGSLGDIEHTLTLWEKTCPVFSTGDIRQRTIDDFKKAMGNMDSTHIDREHEGKRLPISKNTINKHLRNIRTMLIWLQSHNYAASLQVKPLKTEDKLIRILSNTEIKALISACDSATWRLRVILALSTGLRRSDIDNLKIKNIDIERKIITAANKKTGKVTLLQPLPDGIIPEIVRYLAEIPDGQVDLFAMKFNQKHWEKIKRLAGLSEITFHDLRRTFCSLQADAGTPIAAVQSMMNHAKIETTMKHYIRSGESEKRDSVNRLRVGEWL
jgi:integrase